MHQVRHLVHSGALGKLKAVRLAYLQSWLVDDSWGVWHREERWRWRTTAEASCHGVLGDLGSHLFDLARFILPDGELEPVRAAGQRTAREGSTGGAWESVGLACLHHAVPVSLEMNRRAKGHLDHCSMEIDGDRASLRLDLEKSRDSVFLRQRPDGEWQEERGPVVGGTYADFIAALTAGPSAAAGPEQRMESACPWSLASGQDGHAVQELLDRTNRLLEETR